MLPSDDTDSCAPNWAQKYYTLLREMAASMRLLAESDIPKVVESEMSLKLDISGTGEPSASANVKARLLGLELLGASESADAGDAAAKAAAETAIRRLEKKTVGQPRRAARQGKSQQSHSGRGHDEQQAARR